MKTILICTFLILMTLKLAAIGSVAALSWWVIFTPLFILFFWWIVVVVGIIAVAIFR